MVWYSAAKHTAAIAYGRYSFEYGQLQLENTFLDAKIFFTCATSKPLKPRT